MRAMDDAPYSLQFCLLQAALRACGLSPVASADVQGVAAKIAGAARRFRVREQLTSVKRAKDEVKRARAEDKRARESFTQLSWGDCSRSRTARLPPAWKATSIACRRPETMTTSAP
jgi:hypothetical protein